MNLSCCRLLFTNSMEKNYLGFTLISVIITIEYNHLDCSVNIWLFYAELFLKRGGEIKKRGRENFLLTQKYFFFPDNSKFYTLKMSMVDAFHSFPIRLLSNLWSTTSIYISLPFCMLEKPIKGILIDSEPHHESMLIPAQITHNLTWILWLRLCIFCI